MLPSARAKPESSAILLWVKKRILLLLFYRGENNLLLRQSREGAAQGCAEAHSDGMTVPNMSHLSGFGNKNTIAH